jgi:hypothetical protein
MSKGHMSFDQLLDILQNKQPSTATVSNPDSPVMGPTQAPNAILGAGDPVKPRNRCFFGNCNKKLMLTDITCKCNERFCMAHRQAEVHCCTFDFKSEAKCKLMAANPKVDGTKLDRI